MHLKVIDLEYLLSSRLAAWHNFQMKIQREDGVGKCSNLITDRWLLSRSSLQKPYPSTGPKPSFPLPRSSQPFSETITRTTPPANLLLGRFLYSTAQAV